MKKLLLAVILIAALSFPAAAEIRLSASLDGGDTFGDSLGISAHFQWLFPIVGNAFKLGPGASFMIPLEDASQLAVYASGQVYPLNFSGGNVPWYLKLNLGFNTPLFDAGGDGGLFWGWGTGWDITKALFAEIAYGAYRWGVGSISSVQGVWHFTFGFKF